MEPITRALADQHDELDQLLTGLSTDQWVLQSRCDGWTVADVVLHLAQTDELALASGRGAFGGVFAGAGTSPDGRPPRDVDEAAALSVAAERGASGAQVHRRWRASATQLRDFLSGCDPRRPLAWVAGPLPARTLATTRLAEAWIHTADVADAVGIEPDAGERLWHIARLAWRTLPYAFTRAGYTPEGPISVELGAPDGSSWVFAPSEAASTVVRGPATEFCLVAARRLDPGASTLTTDGPDGRAVLDLLRTYA